MDVTTVAPARPRFPLSVRALLTVVALIIAEVTGALAAVALPPLPGRILGSAVVAGAGLGLAVLLIRRVDRRPASGLGLGRRPKSGLSPGRWPASGLGLGRRPASGLSPGRWPGSGLGFGRWPGAGGRGAGGAVWGSLIGLAAVAVAVAAATAVAVACGLTEAPAAAQRFSGTAVPVLLVQAFVLQAFPEEVLFRGYLVQTALGRLPGWGVVTLSCLLFGVLHLASASGAQTIAQRLLFLLIPIGFALIATVLRLATGSVWPAVAVHGGFHLSTYAAGWWVAPSPGTYGAYLALTGGALLVVGGVLARAGRSAEFAKSDATCQVSPRP